MNRISKQISRCFVQIACGVAVAVISGCGDSAKSPSANSSTLDGERLARTYCATCHAYDEPILPYTTAEQMDCGWAWQIEHEHFINRT